MAGVVAQRGSMLLIYGLVALAVLGTLTGIAYKIRESGKDAVRAEWDADKAAARKREAELSAFAAKALSDERAKRRVVIQQRTVHVDREIEKPVYRDICLPATGVCLANAAINGTVPAGCFADGGVPAVKPPS